MSISPSQERVPQIKDKKQENPNVTTLKAAFPDVDAAVISAVLIASSNNLEKAFDGLLGMSDPDFTPDPPVVAPVLPPVSEEEQRQILADEQFARQLASQSSHRYRVPEESRRRATPTAESGEQERSFLDDDLPVLKENLIQGFNETKIKVGSFISNLRTQIEQRMETSQQQGNEGDRSPHADSYHSYPRASTQYDRDARTLDDDFGELQLQDNSESGISIPNGKTKEVEKEVAHSAGIGPSKATPNTSRWQPLAETPSLPRRKTAEERESFALGDDEDE